MLYGQLCKKYLSTSTNRSLLLASDHPHFISERHISHVLCFNTGSVIKLTSHAAVVSK